MHQVMFLITTKEVFFKDLLTVNFSLADLYDDILILMNHMCLSLKFLSSFQQLIFIMLGLMVVDHIVINKTLIAELNSRHIL